MFKKMMGRRNFLKQVGAGICAGRIRPSVAVADEKPARKRNNPAARVSLARARGKYKKRTQDVKFPRYVRYVDDAADMVRIIRGEKTTDFSHEHDLTVQKTLLKVCGLPRHD